MKLITKAKNEQIAEVKEGFNSYCGVEILSQRGLITANVAGGLEKRLVARLATGSIYCRTTNLFRFKQNKIRVELLGL